MRKFIIAILITVLNGILFLTSCDKKNDEPNDKDAVARITVTDEKGVPQGGLPVLIYDEEGYEKFRKDRNTEAKAFTVTLPNGQVNYRLPYSEWFTAGSRLVAFVIREELDAENYRIWAIRKNIKAAEQIRIDFRIDRTETPADPDVPAVPEEPTGTPIDMYDEENGRTTLFGDTLTLDAEHRLAGNNRYSFIDAGAARQTRRNNGNTPRKRLFRLQGYRSDGIPLGKMGAGHHLGTRPDIRLGMDLERGADRRRPTPLYGRSARNRRTARMGIDLRNETFGRSVGDHTAPGVVR